MSEQQESLNVSELLRIAVQRRMAIPAFNVPYLPMVEPVIAAVVDQDAVALVETARLEWIKFSAGGIQPVMREFYRWNRPGYVWLHLDHVPVIDEDGLRVDYLPLIQEAIDSGYHSVMVDGSRLSLDENIRATAQAAEMAHRAGLPCEAELGAVMGHEAGPLPSYDELFESGMGFTDVEEARRFTSESGCDWLSVAIGNIHGAVSGVRKDQKKISARLNLAHLEKLRQATDIPLVLHGGSGIRRDDLLEAARRGIAKVNVGTEIRQPYEAAFRETNQIASAQDAVYERVKDLIQNYFELRGARHSMQEEGSGA